jgi:hypothetical protein
MLQPKPRWAGTQSPRRRPARHVGLQRQGLTCGSEPEVVSAKQGPHDSAPTCHQDCRSPSCLDQGVRVCVDRSRILPLKGGWWGSPHPTPRAAEQARPLPPPSAWRSLSRSSRSSRRGQPARSRAERAPVAGPGVHTDPGGLRPAKPGPDCRRAAPAGRGRRLAGLRRVLRRRGDGAAPARDRADLSAGGARRGR